MLPSDCATFASEFAQNVDVVRGMGETKGANERRWTRYQSRRLLSPFFRCRRGEQDNKIKRALSRGT